MSDVDPVPDTPPTAETKTEVTDLPDLKEPVDVEKIPSGIKKNTASRKAVQEILEMAESEASYKELMTDHFWEVLRDKCIAKVGLPGARKGATPKEKIEPLDDDTAKAFLQERMEDGKHLGKKVGDLIAKGHTDYLLEYAHSPTLFKKRLQRLFARGSKNLVPPAKPKAEKKAKPVKKEVEKPKKVKEDKKSKSKKKSKKRK